MALISYRNHHGLFFGSFTPVANRRYLETVDVIERFEGKTVWAGSVEVFEVVGHPKQSDAMRYVIVLNLHPLFSDRFDVIIKQGRKLFVGFLYAPFPSPGEHVCFISSVNASDKYLEKLNALGDFWKGIFEVLRGLSGRTN